MKTFKSIIINLTIAAAIIFATYRVVMNNLTIDQADNNIIISVFGLVDEYTVDNEPTVYYRDAGSYQLYSPIPDGATVEQLYCLKSDMDAVINWLSEEQHNYRISNSFIIVPLDGVNTERLIQSAINCSCMMKVSDGMATITDIGLFPFLGEGWSLEGVQPLN